MRRFFIALGAAGSLFFVALLALSYAAPTVIEGWARAAIEHEIDRRLTGEIHALDNSALMRIARRVAGSNGRRIQKTQAVLDALPDRISRVAGQMLDPACACRAKWRDIERIALASHIATLADIDRRIDGLIETKYAEVSASLMREFRIFCSANALVFACLTLVAWRRREAGRELIAPAAVLLGAAAIVGSFQVFGKDWLQTILIGDYAGWWYFPWLAIASGFLADVVFNRARVTMRLLEVAMSVIGGLASAPPC